MSRLRVTRQRFEAERRIDVGDEDERIGDDAVVPAQDPLDEVEDAARVAAREEDREPGADYREDDPDVEEDEDDEVRDGQKPLDERQPAVQGPRSIGVVKVEAHVLLLVGRGVAIAHEGEVGADAVSEAQELAVPVKPPARVLLAEDEHEKRREKKEPRASEDDGRRGNTGADLRRATAERGEDEGDRDDREDAKARAHAVEVAVRVID